MNGLQTTARLWIEACDRLGFPYDQSQLSRAARVRVWDEIDRLRSVEQHPSTAS